MASGDLGAATAVAFSALVFMAIWKGDKRMYPADAERVKEQTNKVFKIQALKVIHHARKRY